ncbi:MAG: GNAT family N-acetyltransferase [Chitinophagales bacterium]
MRIENFDSQDLVHIPALQPPSWGDLVPRFRYFIQSDFCFPKKISINGNIAAVGAIINHGDSAWLACIVVHPDYRNKGLGTFITEYLMDQVDESIYKTIYLDATKLGFPIYEKLGFITELEYLHLKSENDLNFDMNLENVVDFSSGFQEKLLNLDRLVSGEDRRRTILEQIGTAKLVVARNDLLGFYIPGLADGLIIASDPRAGIKLMKLRLRDKKFAIFPSCNKKALEFLYQHQFVEYRNSKRMRWGRERAWRPESLYNRISGQLG